MKLAEGSPKGVTYLASRSVTSRTREPTALATSNIVLADRRLMSPSDSLRLLTTHWVVARLPADRIAIIRSPGTA